MEDAHVLPDVLCRGLRVVFCGTAAGRASASRGAYYAGRGNAFWETLHTVGFTPTRLAPEQFRVLLDFGFGLTDIAKLRSGNDADLRSDDFDVDGFKDKLDRYAPNAIAFNGKAAAAVLFGRDSLEYGLQAGTSGPAVWVLPSTSGAARAWWDIEHWKALAASVSRPI